MAKVKFNQHENMFYLIDDNNVLPIPPLYELRFSEPAEFIIRLHSTRGNVAAWWKAGESAAAALNSSPYCPVLRAAIRSFEWCPPDYKRFASNFEPWKNQVIQGGKEVANFIVEVASPLEDKAREILAEIFKRPYCTFDSQGKLEIYQLVPTYCNILKSNVNELYQYAWSRKIRVFSHYFMNCDSFVHRVFGNEILGVVWANDDSYVLSPDYFEDPIKLYKAVWGFRHPYCPCL